MIIPITKSIIASFCDTKQKVNTLKQLVDVCHKYKFAIEDIEQAITKSTLHKKVTIRRFLYVKMEDKLLKLVELGVPQSVCLEVINGIIVPPSIYIPTYIDY